MKERALLTGTLGLSILIHALVLFTPSRWISQSNPRSERYRVALLQDPIRAAGGDRLLKAAAPTASPVAPSAGEQSEKIRPEVANKSAPEADMANADLPEAEKPAADKPAVDKPAS